MHTSDGTDGWLDPVRRALDRCVEPLTVFVRDDDIGWDDERLKRLLDVIADADIPVDLAVIPSELTEARAEWLRAVHARFPARLGLHQHGWTHANHEPDGARKSEFGPARPASVLKASLDLGRSVLAARLGGLADPIFTPPWNRCAAAVGPLLVRAGFAVLSRDRSASALGVPGLVECPTTIDWFAKRRGVRVSRLDWVRELAQQVGEGDTIGLLLHHAVTDDTELVHIGAVLAVLRAHPMCRFVSLLDAARAAKRTPPGCHEAPAC